MGTQQGVQHGTRKDRLREKQVCLQMIEHGPSHGLKWTRSIVMLTSNVGSELAIRIAQDRAKVHLQQLLSDHTPL